MHTGNVLLKVGKSNLLGKFLMKNMHVPGKILQCWGLLRFCCPLIRPRKGIRRWMNSRFRADCQRRRIFFFVYAVSGVNWWLPLLLYFKIICGLTGFVALTSGNGRHWFSRESWSGLLRIGESKELGKCPSDSISPGARSFFTTSPTSRAI